MPIGDAPSPSCAYTHAATAERMSVPSDTISVVERQVAARIGPLPMSVLFLRDAVVTVAVVLVVPARVAIVRVIDGVHHDAENAVVPQRIHGPLDQLIRRL